MTIYRFMQFPHPSVSGAPAFPESFLSSLLQKTCDKILKC